MDCSLFSSLNAGEKLCFSKKIALARNIMLQNRKSTYSQLKSETRPHVMKQIEDEFCDIWHLWYSVSEKSLLSQLGAASGGSPVNQDGSCAAKETIASERRDAIMKICNIWETWKSSLSKDELEPHIRDLNLSRGGYKSAFTLAEKLVRLDSDNKYSESRFACDTEKRIVKLLTRFEKAWSIRKNTMITHEKLVRLASGPENLISTMRGHVVQQLRSLLMEGSSSGTEKALGDYALRIAVSLTKKARESITVCDPGFFYHSGALQRDRYVLLDPPQRAIELLRVPDVYVTTATTYCLLWNEASERQAYSEYLDFCNSSTCYSPLSVGMDEIASGAILLVKTVHETDPYKVGIESRAAFFAQENPPIFNMQKMLTEENSSPANCWVDTTDKKAGLSFFQWTNSYTVYDCLQRPCDCPLPLTSRAVVDPTTVSLTPIPGYCDGVAVLSNPSCIEATRIRELERLTPKGLLQFETLSPCKTEDADDLDCSIVLENRVLESLVMHACDLRSILVFLLKMRDGVSALPSSFASLLKKDSLGNTCLDLSVAGSFNRTVGDLATSSGFTVPQAAFYCVSLCLEKRARSANVAPFISEAEFCYFFSSDTPWNPKHRSLSCEELCERILFGNMLCSKNLLGHDTLPLSSDANTEIVKVIKSSNIGMAPSWETTIIHIKLKKETPFMREALVQSRELLASCLEQMRSVDDIVRGKKVFVLSVGNEQCESSGDGFLRDCIQNLIDACDHVFALNYRKRTGVCSDSHVFYSMDDMFLNPEKDPVVVEYLCLLVIACRINVAVDSRLNPLDCYAVISGKEYARSGEEYALFASAVQRCYDLNKWGSAKEPKPYYVFWLKRLSDGEDPIESIADEALTEVASSVAYSHMFEASGAIKKDMRNGEHCFTHSLEEIHKEHGSWLQNAVRVGGLHATYCYLFTSVRSTQHTLNIDASKLIRWNLKPNRPPSVLMGIVDNYIENMDECQLRSFVSFCTGSRMVMPGTKITIAVLPDAPGKTTYQTLPVSTTCMNILQIPNYDTLKPKGTSWTELKDHVTRKLCRSITCGSLVRA